jgi:hypothetical protein
LRRIVVASASCGSTLSGSVTTSACICDPERFPVELINVGHPCESRSEWGERDPAKRFANEKAQLYQNLADAFERDQVEGLIDAVTIGQLANIRYPIRNRFERADQD